ncbi:fimbrial biogenesis chaperone [Sphingobium algorifonticola]|uniref:Molecular chaperone n=1 Tax=Sphingobium algorifonticola TaxID=2008318 RepID=A0A437J8Q0_9SPHN|nr:fimbria/pilus periplasmic chaperone [Sphingobium algorifonticola]RVT41879.1 molecular chaperone [Sphingobium algorifonticola]
MSRVLSPMVCGCALTLGLAHPARVGAQGLAVTPTLIEIPAGRSSAAIEVRNREANAVAVQLSAFSWSQPGGLDVLMDDPQLLVSPAIATIAPGGVQTFRIIVPRGARPIERSWRIILDQLPRPQPVSPPLSVRLRLSIPIFAAPDGKAAPDIRWHTADGVMIARNTGNRRIRFGALAIDGVPLAAGSSPYLLPGAERHWMVGPRRPVRLAAQTDSGAIHAMLAPSAP